MAARQAAKASARWGAAAAIDDGRLADGERAHAVVDRDARAGQLALELVGDRGQHLERHLRVGLVLEADDVGQRVALAPHDAREGDDAAAFAGVARDGGDDVLERERLASDGDPRGGAALRPSRPRRAG